MLINTSDITFTVDKDGKVKVDGKDIDKVTMIDEYNTASLKVKKTVTGDMGNKNDVFDFTMTLTDSKNAVYTKSVSYKKGTETGTLTPDGNGKVSFTLSHGETIEFADLLVGTKYEVSEKDYSENGYTTSSKNASGTVEKTNPDVEFTNSKNIMVPTGIREDFPLGDGGRNARRNCVYRSIQKTKVLIQKNTETPPDHSQRVFLRSSVTGKRK